MVFKMILFLTVGFRCDLVFDNQQPKSDVRRFIYNFYLTVSFQSDLGSPEAQYDVYLTHPQGQVNGIFEAFVLSVLLS